MDTMSAFIPAVPAALNHERGTLMEVERIVFSEETGPAQSLRLIAKGELDACLLEALEDYIKRQKKRLGAQKKSSPSELRQTIKANQEENKGE